MNRFLVSFVSGKWVKCEDRKKEDLTCLRGITGAQEEGLESL